MKEKFKISVIMPLYNAQEYLDESVTCILEQSLDFAKNIQIIFVNDGSKDDTEKIALKYQAKYPENIIYHIQENRGVSAARNFALNDVKGTYVVFFDWDDLWDCHAFEKACAFFDKYYDEVDVCCCKMDYIGDLKGKRHPLDFKFNLGNRVVNLETEPKMIQSTIGNVLHKAEIVKTHRFNEELITGEDNLFNNEILLKKRRLGIIADSHFYYRRNYGGAQLSGSSTKRKEWFTDRPEQFYIRLCKASIEKYDIVKPFIQYAVAYDLQWTRYNPAIEYLLNEGEKAQYLADMSKVADYIDYSVIADLKGIDPYYKLYLYLLKEGSCIPADAKVDKGRLIYQEKPIFSFREKSFCKIMTFAVGENNLELSGYIKIPLDAEISLCAEDKKGNIYHADLLDFNKADMKGFIGERFTRGKRFIMEIPVSADAVCKFFVFYKETKIQLNPSFQQEIGLTRDCDYSYIIEGEYIIKYSRKAIRFCNNSFKTRLCNRYRLACCKKSKKAKSWYEDVWKRNYKVRRIADRAKLKKQVAFVSVRKNDELLPNMAAVYDKVQSSKLVFSKMNMLKESKTVIDAAKVIARSKVIVTDDYLRYLAIFGKKKGQKVIQIWHAVGAFKKFGADAPGCTPEYDAVVHKDYDFVSVSSEGIREIYAHAFSVPVESVGALGTPRTDMYFDEEYIKSCREKIYASHPELKDKEVLIYAPTFRDIPGINRKYFTPEIDFETMSRQLNPNQIFVICPHPVVTEKIVDKDYSNIIEIRDIDTNTMMFVGDLLITDYSSVIFEFALLKKPMIFYCYDYDDYDRDFYLDYEHDLPGKIVRNDKELIRVLKTHDYDCGTHYDEFLKKYMGACDGHSAQRVADLIETYMES